MKYKMRNFFVSGVTLGIGLAALQTSDAAAAFARVHSLACTQPIIGGTTKHPDIVHSGDLTWQRSGVIYCAVPTDGALPHMDVVYLNVHGYEPSGESNTAKACVQDYDAIASTCGTTKNWGSAYSGAIGIDVSKWSSNSSWFPFVTLSMTPGSRVFGIYLGD